MSAAHCQNCGHELVIVIEEAGVATELAALTRALRKLNTKVGSLMGITDDILAAENTEAAAVTALSGVVGTALTTLQSVQTQLAELIANGGLSDTDNANLQSVLDEATASTTALQATTDEVNAALNPVPPADPTV